MNSSSIWKKDIYHNVENHKREDDSFHMDVPLLWVLLNLTDGLERERERGFKKLKKIYLHFW